MKRMFLVSLVAILALVAAPTWAQEDMDAGTICCRELATGKVEAWVAPVGMCPDGWERVSQDLCPGMIPPTPVPTPADFTPKDITVGSFWSYVIELIGKNLGKAVAIPAGLAALLIWITGLLRIWVPKLEGRAAYAVTVAVTSLTTLAVVAEDAIVSPGEWATVLVALVAMVAAPFGYNLVFKGRK